jgi:hypothetical protein
MKKLILHANLFKNTVLGSKTDDFLTQKLLEFIIFVLSAQLNIQKKNNIPNPFSQLTIISTIELKKEADKKIYEKSVISPFCVVFRDRKKFVRLL